jgi:hypothetical protein
MNQGKSIFAQIMEHLPLPDFRRCVERYGGDYKVKSFSCLDQFLCMAFAQLSYRESLRDIEACLRSMASKLYHMGIRGKVSRSTLADANESRDWRIFADFAQGLIRTARVLYQGDRLASDLRGLVYAFDSTTIDLCLKLFPWARFRKHKAGIKLHTLLDLRGNIPSMIHITAANVADVRLMDELLYEPGAYYVFDRAYLDFSRLSVIHHTPAFFVIRAKDNIGCRRLYSRPIDKTAGIRADQTIVLTGIKTSRDYPEKLRRVKYYVAEHDLMIELFTNDFLLSAVTLAEMYRGRWKIELFFKWIKQHLRIKAFFGTSSNAVKTQIWIAIAIYVLVAILKKRLSLEANLYKILQILSISLFEKNSIIQQLTENENRYCPVDNPNQLSLF